ncbi:hypothetical protein GQ53DRAFT_308926 [Thozetella sp. PMI_491]|nr:hypothetical protein GQ53DRAFT_308926 [Thozetella sp. PMI_491]
MTPARIAPPRNFFSGNPRTLPPPFRASFSLGLIRRDRPPSVRMRFILAVTGNCPGFLLPSHKALSLFPLPLPFLFRGITADAALAVSLGISLAYLARLLADRIAPSCISHAHAFLPALPFLPARHDKLANCGALPRTSGYTIAACTSGRDGCLDFSCNGCGGWRRVGDVMV